MLMMMFTVVMLLFMVLFMVMMVMVMMMSMAMAMVKENYTTTIITSRYNSNIGDNIQCVCIITFQVELTNPMGGELKDWDADRTDSQELANYVLNVQVSNGEIFELVPMENPQTVTLNFTGVSQKSAKVSTKHHNMTLH